MPDWQRGNAAIEFALVLPVIFLILLASLELLVVARTQLQITYAAREGAREAATNPNHSVAVDAARNALPSPLSGMVNVTVEREHVVGGEARVSVHAPHRFAGALFGGLVVDLRARAVMRVER